MELIIRLLTVFLLGTVELWVAIPAGIALGLNPLAAGVASAAGAVAGVFVILMLGERIRALLIRRKGEGEIRNHGRVYRIWMRYGVAGLGLIAPSLIGAPAGTVLGITLGAPAGRLLFWMSFGILICSMALSLAGMIAVASIEALWK